MECQYGRQTHWASAQGTIYGHMCNRTIFVDKTELNIFWK